MTQKPAKKLTIKHDKSRRWEKSRRKSHDNVIRVRIKTSQEQENQGRLQVINNTVEGLSHSPKAVGSRDKRKVGFL